MKNIKKFMTTFSLVLMAFVCAFAFTGCGTTDEFAKADSATADEITEYLDGHTETGFEGGFELNSAVTITYENQKTKLDMNVKVLFEEDAISKAVCTMTMSGGGDSVKLYAYIKDSKVYTRTVSKIYGQSIDAKYVNDLNENFEFYGEDLSDMKNQIKLTVDSVLKALTDASEEELEELGLKKIINESKGTAKFQIKTEELETDEETEEVSTTKYTYVLGFEGKDLVEIKSTIKSDYMDSTTTIKAISSISDNAFPSASELAKYVKGSGEESVEEGNPVEAIKLVETELIF